MSESYQWFIETMGKDGHEWVSVRRQPFMSVKVALTALQTVVADPHWKYQLLLCRQDVNGLGLIVRKSEAIAEEYSLPDIFVDSHGIAVDLVPPKYKRELEVAYATLYPITYATMTAKEVKWRWPSLKGVLGVVFIYHLLLVILTAQLPSMAQFIFNTALSTLVAVIVCPSVSWCYAWLRSKLSK